MADIDSLQIKINAEASKANDAIDRLVGKLDRLTTSLNRLDGGKLSSLASGVQRLGTAMQTMNSVKTADFTRLARNLQTLNSTDTSKLSNLSVNVKHIATAFSGLNGMEKSAEQITALANGIKQLGYKSADKAIANIPQLATAMKNLMAELSTAPKVSQNLIDMTNALAKLARTGASSGKAANSLVNSFNRVSKASKGLKFNLLGATNGISSIRRSILSAMGVAGGFYAVIRGIKESINLSSDLTEVQNVVDNTFGNMAYKVEEFAKTSIQQLGMSELSVKQYASRFQSMGVAMGITAQQVGDANAYLANKTDGYVKMSDSLSDVSLNLTKLTADMASFYNVAQEDVAEDLASIFTGQTRPLRTYGLDLTQATIKEWAMKQGLDADIASMTQAEKTMLRYQYVLANTEAVQGDFARTADTWANQLRILQEQIKQLGIITGKAFINALKPMVSALNNAMGVVINFAETVVNALGVIFGWKLEITSGAVADDYEDAAGYADDLASGTGKAADNAKKLKQQLQGFHELNVLTSPTDSDTGGSGSGSGAAGTGTTGGGGTKFNIVETESAFKSQIDTLYKLGEYIGDTITKGLNNIDWNKVYQGAKNFGKGLADFLNGLISPELFGAVGSTIAKSLNTAIYSALSFGETFDFDELGLSIATGINNFFRDFDFKALANTLNTWAHGILSSLKTAISTVDWSLIGGKIGEFINDIDVGDLLLDFGELALNILKALGDAIKGLYSENPLAGAIAILLGGVVLTNKLDGLAKHVISVLGIGIEKEAEGAGAVSLKNAFCKMFNTSYLSTNISEWSTLTGKQIFGAVCIGLTTAFAGFSFGKWLYENTDLGTAVDTVIEAFDFTRPKDVTDTGDSDYTSRYNVAMGFFSDLETEKARKNAQIIADAWETFVNQGMSSSDAWALAMQKAKNMGGKLSDNLRDVYKDGYKVSSVTGKTAKELEHYGDKYKDTSTKITNSSKKTRIAIEDETKETNEQLKSVAEQTESTSILAAGALGSLKTSTINTFNDMSSATSRYASNMYTNVGLKFNAMSVLSKDAVRSMSDDILSKMNTMSSDTSDIASKMSDNVKNFITSMSSSAKLSVQSMSDDTRLKFDNMKSGAVASASGLNDGVSSNFTITKNNTSNLSESIRASVVGKFGDAKNGAVNAFSLLQNDTQKQLNNARLVIERENWHKPGVNLVEGLNSGIKSKWSTGNNSLLSNIISLANSLTRNLKNAFGIHSPSKIWNNEIGIMLTRGLGEGIIDGKGKLLTETVSLADSINASFFDNLELSKNPFDDMQQSIASTSAKLSSEINGTTKIESANLTRDIANGISSGMSISQAEQNMILREQNELLRQLISKDTSISSNDIFESVKRSNRQAYKMTGANPLVY